jgi:hypothetical protein
MKRLSIVLLAVTVSVSSCATNQEKETAKEGGSTSFQPKPLDDEWSKWLVGEWKVVSGESWVTDKSGKVAKIDVGKEGAGGTKTEFGLNGQFLVMTSEAGISEITDEQRQYLKDALHASDEDIERSLSMPFKELQIHTIDPKTGERVGYLFDSMRCIAIGTGRLEGNKEIMEWVWSGTAQGATSVRIIERINDNKFAYNHKYILPDGKKMEDKVEMVRRKTITEK